MMLNRINSGFLVAAVITLFFLVSFVIGSVSVNTAAVNVEEQPAEVIQDDASVTVIRETTSAKPFMGDTILEASRNWADYAETDSQAYELPQPNVDGGPY